MDKLRHQLTIDSLAGSAAQALAWRELLRTAPSLPDDRLNPLADATAGWLHSRLFRPLPGPERKAFVRNFLAEFPEAVQVSHFEYWESFRDLLSAGGRM